MNGTVKPSFSTTLHFGLHPKNKREQWKLIIHCENCPHFILPPTERYKTTLVCSECIIESLDSITQEKNITQIELGTNLYLPSEDLSKFQELKELFSEWSKAKLESKQCKNNCPLQQVFTFEEYLFKMIRNEIASREKICSFCIKIRDKFKSSTLWQYFSKIPDKNRISDLLYIGPYGQKPKFTHMIAPQNDVPEVSYILPEFPLFSITIFQYERLERLYVINNNFGMKSPKVYSTIISTVNNKIPSLYFDHLLSIGQVLEKYSVHYENFIRLNYHNLDDEEIQNLALYLALQNLHLKKIFPLLLDDSIDEIYLDAPNKQIYLDHRDWGRCITNITMTERDIDAITTYLRISSNKRLDSTNPSIKHTIHNQYFQCRWAVDVAPGVVSGFAMNIRKMNRKVFTLPELIYKGLCSSEIASFFYMCLIRRINLTTVGETNTGKTTLINSLDLLIPSHFRKIYIEESPESLEIPDSHQLKYLVDSVYNNSSKVHEIHRLLHRNPDFVYLGEILTKQEAQAMFQCLSAGLRGFQTIHARDINSLINRWQFHFDIEPHCFNDLDVVILLQKKRSIRYVAKIVEIQYNLEHVKVIPIFIYNPETSQWEKKTKWEDLQCFQRLLQSKQEKLLINQQLRFFSKVFTILSNNRSWNSVKLYKFFQFLYKEISGSHTLPIKEELLQNYIQKIYTELMLTNG